MSYLQDLGKELKPMLSELPENEQKEIIGFVAKKVLESYKNGMEVGKKQGTNVHNKPAKGRKFTR